MSKDETIEVDGPRVAAKILCRLPNATRAQLVESIRTVNPQSAMAIESIIIETLSCAPAQRSSPGSVPAQLTQDQPVPNALHTSKPISAITQISDAKLQQVLREVSPRDLAVSLKHAPREAQEKVLSNISSTKQHEVLNELQQLPPMRVVDVEAAQARLLKSVDAAYADDTPAPPPPSRRLRSRLA